MKQERDGRVRCSALLGGTVLLLAVASVCNTLATWKCQNKIMAHEKAISRLQSLQPHQQQMSPKSTNGVSQDDQPRGGVAP